MAGEINLYDAFATDYDNEGLCVLQPLDWYHKEVGNADSVLTVIHPYDAEGRHALLERGCILKAEVPVRTVPEIQNGAIIQTAELWTVRLTATKTERYQYTRATGGHRMKRIPAGYEVTVVEKGEERYKIKTSKYGTGWIAHSALEVKIVDVPYETDSDIEAATPSVNVRAQLFRITDVEKDDDKITVTAWHISYDWAGNMVTLDFTGDIRGQTFLNGLVHFCVREHDFNAVTDIGDKRISAQLIRTNPIAAILGEGGFIQRYGGELIRDNFDLTILRRAGMDRGFTIEYAKNLTGITFNVSDDGVVTSIVPIGKNEDGGDLYLDGQIWVDAPNSAEFAVPRIKELQVEDAKVGEGVTEDNARDRMLEAVQAEWDKGVHLPTMSVKVSFERLGDTAVYAQYKELEKCYLYDTVRVWHPKICGEQSLTVVSQTWNGMQQRYTECELGSLGLRLGNSKITNLQLPNNISGLKIAPQSIGGTQLGSETIATRHLQAGSVNTEALQADSVTAEKVNTESLFADNVFADSLYAKVGEFVEIVAGNIKADKIDVDKLTANIVKSVQVSALMADFDKATVKNLVAQALFLQYGNGDEVHIKNLSVDYAQMVGATIGKLCIKSSDGKYYNIDVNADGSVTATDVSEEIGDTGVNGALTPDGKRVIVETSMTVDDLNAGTFQAIYAMINKLDAAMIDTDELVAREAFIQKLVTAEINSSGDTIELIAKKAAQGNVYTGNNPPANPAEGQLWVDTGVDPTVMRSWMGYDIPTDREIPFGELTADVVKFYPQTIRGDVEFVSEVECWQEGEGDPYENIRPIHGRTDTSITLRGKNICPGVENGIAYANASGNDYVSASYCRTKKIPVEEGVTYIESISYNVAEKYRTYHFWDADGNWLGYSGYSLNNRPAGAAMMGISYYHQDTSKIIEWVQVEIGSVATDYEPYHGITKTCAFDSILYGKNLLKQRQFVSLTSNGISFVQQADGGIMVSGTASADASCNLSFIEDSTSATFSYPNRTLTASATEKLSKIVITAQPENATVVEGGTAVFTVAATGEGLSYQWEHMTTTGTKWNTTTAGTGVTTNELGIEGKAYRDGYIYHCVITDANGNSVTSESAKLTIAPIVISQQPDDQTAAEGNTVVFTVTAEGKSLTYQWQWRANSTASWGNTTVAGNQTKSITVEATKGRNGYQYRCLIKDANSNTKLSNAVTLIVESQANPITITAQPTSVTAALGSKAVFTVIAEGEGLTYQWEWRANSDTDWSNTTVAGNQTNSITVDATKGRNGYQYRCLIKDANGYGKLSNAVTLIVESQASETLVLAFGSWDESGATVSKGTVSDGGSLTFEGNGELARIYLMVYSGATVSTVIYPKLEIGSEATSYEPYDEYYGSFNSTIYGGSYDWKTGVLTVTHQRIVFDGSKDENWFSLNGAYNAYAPVYNIAEVSDTLISNRFVNAPDIGVNYLSANQMRQGGIYTNLVFGNPNNISTEEWCASLSLNPIEVVYELAEPYTIQYDPQEIEIPDVEEVIVFSSSGGTSVLAKISGWDTITADTVALEEKMAEAVLDINSDIGNLQSQIDGNITTWFYKYPPTLENEPASKWTDDAAKNNHLGDLFYDETTGYCYRFQLSDGVYGWNMIQDTDIAKALANAKNAQDTADNKRRVFYDTPPEIPTPPYDVGDLWVQGSNGDILRCNVARTGDETGLLGDWVNASKYTDDTVANETKEQIKLRVSGVDIEYAKNKDPDNHPAENSAEWSTTVPTWQSGYYIWSRTVYVRGTAENPEKVYSGYTCLTTATSKSIKNIQEEFYVSTSKTEPIDGAWTTVSPSWSAGTYLWIRFVITYDDDTSVRKDPFLDETWSAAERTMEIASAARDQADAALKAARDAVTLPDFERVIRVKPDGLHVGDNKTSSEVLIDSASVNVVVNGVTYSTFGPGFLQLGDDIRVRRPTVGGIAFSPIIKESGS